MVAYLFTEKKFTQMCNKRNAPRFKSYFYKLKVTTGFIVGAIIDQIVWGTFGLPIQYLKRFGKIWYETEIKLNKFTNNRYFKGFLE